MQYKEIRSGTLSKLSKEREMYFTNQVPAIYEM